jgi:threonine efflux protein
MTNAPTLAALGTFSLLWWAQVAVPGPNFVRITDAALSGSRRAAMTTAAGVAVGNALWCLIALSGAAIFQKQPELRQFIAAAGVAYFAWLGIKMLQRAWTGRSQTSSRAQNRSAGGTIGPFWRGLATTSLNPQSLVYFTAAVVGGFSRLSPGLGLVLIAIVLGVTLIWYEAITRLLDNPAARDGFERRRSVIEGVFGLLLLVGAAKLALPLILH